MTQSQKDAKAAKAAFKKENETPVTLTALEQAKLDKKILDDKIKALKEAEKVTKAKKTNKGQPVTFKNKAGETITGLGNLYYVVKFGGKLHYKEISSVTVLPADYDLTKVAAK